MISIVIIVKNDQRVRAALESLRVVVKPDSTETLVVDASPGRQVIQHDFPEVRWIRYEAKADKATMPEQRNVGISGSSGDVVVFIDADCIPEEDWLKCLVKPILEGHERITAGESVARPKSYMRLGDMTKKPYMDECATMNMAVRRDVFKRVGLFDEKFERAEDSDFCYRARMAGYRIRAVPQAIVYHDWGGVRENIRRSYGSGVGRAQFYRKHPAAILSRDAYRNRKNPYSVIYGAYAVMLPLSVLCPLYLLLPFVASLVYRRSPWKEVVNVAFGIGLVVGLVARRTHEG